MANKRIRNNINKNHVFLICFVVIVIVLSVVIYSTKINKQQVLDPSESGISQETKANLYGCGANECLYQRSGSDVVEGFAKISGYYTSYQTEAGYGDTNKITCDAFVVPYGNTRLTNSLKEDIRAGNTLNRIVKGDLVININLTNLNADEVSLIKSSSFNNLVNLGILRYTPVGRDANPCDSVVSILNAELTE